MVDHHRVVDDEVHRHLRVDGFGRGTELGGRIAHGGEVHHGGHTGEVLHQHTGRAVGDLVLGRALVIQPGGHGLDVFLLHRIAVFKAQEVLKEHLQRGRQFRHIAEAVFGGLGEGVVCIGLVADGKSGFGFETVE